MNKAYLIIEKRIMATDCYRRLFDMAVKEAVSVCLKWETVEDSRRGGGRTKVVNEAIEQAIRSIPGANENFGSKLIPMTPADVLRRQCIQVQQEAVRVEFKQRWAK